MGEPVCGQGFEEWNQRCQRRGTVHQPKTSQHRKPREDRTGQHRVPGIWKPRRERHPLLPPVTSVVPVLQHPLICPWIPGICFRSRPDFPRHPVLQVFRLVDSFLHLGSTLHILDHLQALPDFRLIRSSIGGRTAPFPFPQAPECFFTGSLKFCLYVYMYYIYFLFRYICTPWWLHILSKLCF